MNSIFKKRTAKEYTVYSLIIAVGIILDQLTKWLSVKFLSVIDTCPIIKGVIHLTYVENRGAAFGMFSDKRWVFMLSSTVMMSGRGRGKPRGCGFAWRPR